ncbi:MAG TPA: DNA gyrase subunit A [Bacilli bacterium]|jgi:DNA gyrase subunit A|nr:MAG: DNA gyrase subunit A [Tenericutes bacterium ADurb.Bin140]HOE77015.1 DNA gyrase subunit A [Bacilli bacterium]HOR95505.1 DNA gyrase subunit A [Bacilli bacterium]HPD11958.1 DNA gyrase subunit A [Bacilli bacterium]HPN89758.1 DNA gyrase subunit A [Bacilli bacterium]
MDDYDDIKEFDEELDDDLDNEDEDIDEEANDSEEELAEDGDQDETEDGTSDSGDDDENGSGFLSDNGRGEKDVNLTSEMKNSFLSYAMSVIVSRALPDVRDGLKPVHRRILYAMNELGVYSDRPHKKSARIVGDVIGKYHPHGDSAVYEAMVRMAQDFSYRYPLVDGHGNFGSVDGDGAAAMRYTEARLSKIAAEMLRDLNKNTVDFQDNYDGSEKEPVVLPSRIPNLLVNGATGIAVGMATNIPTHNLSEVIDGVLALIKNPDITVDELMEYIPAPDFPTGGIIVGVKELKNAYETGTGTITIRGKVKVEKTASGKQEIIITEIPFQVNKTRLIERIAEIAKNKTIEGITDLRDESNRKGMRIIIETRRDVNSAVILNNLYKHTQLQTTFGFNMIALDHGQPRVFNLKTILEKYLEHQVEVITRRTEFDLEKAKARLHIVEGLLIALANIDEVVHVIKTSKTPDIAVTRLTENFLLTEIQAKAILDMRLQRLTGLEIEKLQAECKDLKELVAYLASILESHDKKMAVIVSELRDIQKRFTDERRTQIDYTMDLDVSDEDLIPVEDTIITITNKGYIKRLNVDVYKTQHRGGKGITGARMQENDFVERIIYTSSHDNLLFFTNFGKVYLLKAFQIPYGSRTAKGIPLVNLLNFDEEERLTAVVNVDTIDKDGYLFFATKKGGVKKTELRQYKNIRTGGIRAIILAHKDELIEVALTDGTKDIIIGASSGKAVRFNEEQVRPTNRAASGVKGIQIDKGHHVIGMVVVDSEDDEIMIITTNGYGKRTSVKEFKSKGRNGKGVKFIDITEKNGRPACMKLVKGEDDLIVITDNGMVIRTSLEQISTIGRDTQGVRIITLNEGNTVAAIAIVPKSDESNREDEEEETEEDLHIQESIRHLDEVDDEMVGDGDYEEDYSEEEAENNEEESE